MAIKKTEQFIGGTRPLPTESKLGTYVPQGNKPPQFIGGTRPLPTESKLGVYTGNRPIIQQSWEVIPGTQHCNEAGGCNGGNLRPSKRPMVPYTGLIDPDAYKKPFYPKKSPRNPRNDEGW